MPVEVRPATRFTDVATVLGPKRDPDATVCWCLSHRLDSRGNRSLVGRERGEYVRTLCRRQVPPGVLAYDGAEVAGWAGVASGMGFAGGAGAVTGGAAGAFSASHFAKSAFVCTAICPRIR